MTKRWRTRRARLAAARQVVAEPAGTEAPEQAATEDPELTRELGAMRDVVALLEEVPGEAWAGLPAPAASAAGARGGLRSGTLRVSPALAVLAVAACIGLGVGAGLALRGSGGGATHGPSVALHPLAGTPARDLATAYMPGPGQMVLRVSHLPPSPAGTYYELWLMTDTKRLAPVAAFRVGQRGSAQLTLRLPDDPHHYAYLDISRQRIGAGTAHSADSVLRGRIA